VFFPDYVDCYRYTRTFLAANPEVFKGGEIDIGGTGSNPVMIPQDITAALTSGSSASSSASIPTDTATAYSTPSTTASSARSSSSASTQKNGAAQLASPRVLLAVTAVLVTFLAL
jgi:hypothetical protein